jgi:molybdate transport system substrate-binding protein
MKRGLARSVLATILVPAATATALVAAAAEPRVDPHSELTVSAAASLTAAFQTAASAFEKAHPGLEVKSNFAGSPTLVQQILEGAPVDVFASADEPNMQRVVDAKKVASTPRIFARNRLAILVQKGNPKKIATLADLAKPGLVVALCGPAVPAGRYAREAFAKAGVKPPETSQELDVKAVASRVVLGEADAGVVYVTDVRAAGDRAEGIDIPDPVNVVARYPIAVLEDTPHRPMADAFVAFVLGAEGRAILEKFGFLAP